MGVQTFASSVSGKQLVHPFKSHYIALCCKRLSQFHNIASSGLIISLSIIEYLLIPELQYNLINKQIPLFFTNRVCSCQMIVLEKNIYQLGIKSKVNYKDLFRLISISYTFLSIKIMGSLFYQIINS